MEVNENRVQVREERERWRKLGRKRKVNERRVKDMAVVCFQGWRREESGFFNVYKTELFFDPSRFAKPNQICQAQLVFFLRPCIRNSILTTKLTKSTQKGTEHAGKALARRIGRSYDPALVFDYLDPDNRESRSGIGR